MSRCCGLGPPQRPHQKQPHPAPKSRDPPPPPRTSAWIYPAKIRMVHPMLHPDLPSPVLPPVSPISPRLTPSFPCFPSFCPRLPSLSPRFSPFPPRFPPSSPHFPPFFFVVYDAPGGILDLGASRPCQTVQAMTRWPMTDPQSPTPKALPATIPPSQACLEVGATEPLQLLIGFWGKCKPALLPLSSPSHSAHAGPGLDRIFERLAGPPPARCRDLPAPFGAGPWRGTNRAHLALTLRRRTGLR